MRYPWVNVILLGLLAVLLLTGAAGLVNGRGERAWILWLHSSSAYAVLTILGYKGAVILVALARRRLGAEQAAFLALAALLAGVLATGLYWTTAGPAYFAGFSLLTLHAMLACLLAALLVWHVLARRFILRVPQARDRRAFLRLAAAGLGGLALWQLARLTRPALALPGARARFTGSYEARGGPGAFPEVSWMFDRPAPLDALAWRLEVGGAVERPLRVDLAALLARASAIRAAVIDCTGGWYSLQEWGGVPLGQLLAEAGVRPAARSVVIEAVSGYRRRFALEEAGGLLLATQVAGEPLSHGHGAPVRLVAPGYRGFDWVKWVVRVEVEEAPAWWQTPVPLQ